MTTGPTDLITHRHHPEGADLKKEPSEGMAEALAWRQLYERVECYHSRCNIYASSQDLSMTLRPQ